MHLTQPLPLSQLASVMMLIITLSLVTKNAPSKILLVTFYYKLLSCMVYIEWTID